MRLLRWLALITVVVVLAAIGAVVSSTRQSSSRQDTLRAFYAAPTPLPSEPGALLRREPLTMADGTAVRLEGATAWRILYSSERPSGEIAVAGGMAFIPDAPAPPGGRPVLAWAHGTVGQGDACAPSRSKDPVAAISSWLPLALARGWIVVATDYTGLGTAGPNLYLVGKAEAADVVHAVHAAQAVPAAHAATRVVIMGHSQGGHAALWTGTLARSMAPDLSVLGVAAIAPAAELPDIMETQWQTPVAWVIGPEVMSSWPTLDGRLTTNVLSDAGARQTTRMADECIGTAAVEGLARTTLGQSYFAMDPLSKPAWSAFARQEVPPPLPPSIPVFLAQSLADDVVLAWPNAHLQEAWCGNDSIVQAEWLGEVSHMKSGLVAGPSAVQWAGGRFAGDPPPSSCATSPPIPGRAIAE